MRWSAWGAGALLAMLCALQPAWGAKVYKWVDGQGEVHYGQAAPPDASATVITTRKSPVSEEEARSRLKALTGEASEQGEEARQDQQNQKLAQDYAARRKQNCETARSNLKVLESSAPVQAQGTDGKPFQLDEAARQAKMAETKAQIGEFCE